MDLGLLGTVDGSDQGSPGRAGEEVLLPAEEEAALGTRRGGVELVHTLEPRHPLYQPRRIVAGAGAGAAPLGKTRRVVAGTGSGAGARG